MDITLRPAVLRGRIPAISSKSFAHRALLAAALARQTCVIRLNCRSADIDASVRALPALGAKGENIPDGVRVVPATESFPPGGIIDCGESGSTLRFLLPVLGARGGSFRLEGHGRLPARPLSPLREILTAHGISFSAEQLPFTLNGQLTAGEFALPGNVSSQYLTGLLLALPLLNGDSFIRLTSPLESAGYVRITLEVLRNFGITVSENPDGFAVAGGQKYRAPADYTVEGDWSNAAFWLVANVLPARRDNTMNRLEVSGLNPQSVQPDRAVVAVLEQFCSSAGRLEIDVSQFPDLVPVLAVAAALRPGVTRFTNGARLRLKESDRIAATVAMINALGGNARELPDGMEFSGVGLFSGGTVDSVNDHRLAMAAGIAATASTAPVCVLGANAVNKSYPGFWEEYHRLQNFLD